MYVLVPYSRKGQHKKKTEVKDNIVYYAVVVCKTRKDKLKLLKYKLL